MYECIGKRIFDFLLAFTAVVLLSPLLSMIALGVVLTSPGPALFSQVRSGAGEVPFKIYKFRSMPRGTKMMPSDRLTEVEIGRFGRLIRRTNLDELPQLFNILRGEMSVVGPRPALPSQDKLLYARRRNGAILCRPGLTGLAQINSFDGMTVEKKAEFDGLYAQQIGLFGDMVIIFKTFAYLMRPPPVY